LQTATATLLDEILERLEKQAPPLSTESLDEVAQAIAAKFHLKIDEVAVLELDVPGELLRFVLPTKLRSVGTIPLKSNTAFVSRTARLRRAEIVNNFEQFRHASVFEGVPLGRRQNEAIQKIVSAPILHGSELLGAVQLCRKGVSPLDAGQDFTASDLADLKTMMKQLARFLSLCRVV
jgi:hypothetical protein